MVLDSTKNIGQNNVHSMFFVDEYRGQRALYDMNPMTTITLKNVTFCDLFDFDVFLVLLSRQAVHNSGISIIYV